MEGFLMESEGFDYCWVTPSYIAEKVKSYEQHTHPRNWLSCITGCVIPNDDRNTLLARVSCNYIYVEWTANEKVELRMNKNI